MAFLWIIIAVHSASILFTAFCLSRLFHYLKRYKMEESRFTLFLGFISLPQIMVMYALMVILFAVISTFYVIALLSS